MEPRARCSVLEPDGNWKAVRSEASSQTLVSAARICLCLLFFSLLGSPSLFFNVLTHHLCRAQVLAEAKVGRGCLLSQHAPIPHLFFDKGN